MAGTIVLPCTCKNEFKDTTYGKGQRLHNIDAEGKQAFCTVCVGGARNAKRTSKASPPTSARTGKSI